MMAKEWSYVWGDDEHRTLPQTTRLPPPHGQVGTKAIWDIYQRIAQEIADPVHKMLQWFQPTKAPRTDAVRTKTTNMTLSARSWLTVTTIAPFHSPQLIYTGGGTKSAVTRMLVEDLLHADGSGPLVKAGALSNDKVCACWSDSVSARMHVVANTPHSPDRPLS